MDKQVQNSLDLYAKVEDLLGVKEVSPRLYAHYFLFLNSLDFHSLLDVGCGSGDFLYQMQKALAIEEVLGIDLSPLMVSKTLKLHLPAQCIDLCKLEGKYDVITAVFDMLNYLDKEALERFLLCISEHLNDRGYFLCDINTLYGFENVAVGSYIVDDNERFLTVDSDFEKGEYISEFTLFEKEKRSFKKSQTQIKQYHHTLEEIMAVSGLKLIECDEVNLYEMEEPDKTFIILQKC
ncbi:MAG: class I SAM-dependent methyltransferase [Campylobacterota bacterium]|nr:class I SAM-dependent methyltransferase [Campylobacterota bacterium]